MASGGRRGVGERVLESRHVIGLFLLMLVFSGVFFALGYVMGRNQYDGQVRAASNSIDIFEPDANLKTRIEPKKFSAPEDFHSSDPSTCSTSHSTSHFFKKGKNY